MQSDVEKTRSMLSEHDPCRSLEEEPSASGERVLRELLASPPDLTKPLARRASRRPLVLVAASAALAVVGLIVANVVSSTSPNHAAFAATPSPLQLPSREEAPARHELLKLAQVAEAQPATVTERYHYVKRRAWYLNTSVGDGSVESQLEPKVIEQWVSDDGSLRTKMTKQGAETDVVQSGPRADGFLPPSQYSSDPAVLERQLVRDPGAPSDKPGSSTASELVDRVVEVLRDFGQLPPGVQGALWRVLADQGLIFRGRITDRGGHTGVALTFDTNSSGLPVRKLLVVDPRTGQLLSYEEVLTKSAGDLDVSIPSVLEYEIFLEVGDVSDDNSTPSGTR